MRGALIKGIKIYQKFISPALGGHCRFFPTCSQYGVEAIEKHGIIKGSLFAFWRILRCNPWNKGGADRP